MFSTLHTLKSLLFPSVTRIKESLFVYVLFPSLFIFTEKGSALLMAISLLLALYFFDLLISLVTFYRCEKMNHDKEMLKQLADDIYIDGYVCISSGVCCVLSFFVVDSLARQVFGLLFAIISLLLFRKVVFLRKKNEI